jgi:iron-sulfur cluster assembly protein
MTDSTLAAGISITDQAVAAVKAAFQADSLSPETTYVRVGVRAGGCSGYSYDLSFTEERDEEDRVIEHGGVRLLLDPRSEMLLRGTTLDYSSGLNGKGFVFTNPNATGTCGCGESFSV